MKQVSAEKVGEASMKMNNNPISRCEAAPTRPNNALSHLLTEYLFLKLPRISAILLIGFILCAA